MPFAWIRALQELLKSLACKFNEVGNTEPSLNSCDVEEWTNEKVTCADHQPLMKIAKFYVLNLNGLCISIPMEETLRFQAIDLHVSINLFQKRRKILGKWKEDAESFFFEWMQLWLVFIIFKWDILIVFILCFSLWRIMSDDYRSV